MTRLPRIEDPARRRLSSFRPFYLLVALLAVAHAVAHAAQAALLALAGRTARPPSQPRGLWRVAASTA